MTELFHERAFRYPNELHDPVRGSLSNAAPGGKQHGRDAQKSGPRGNLRDPWRQRKIEFGDRKWQPVRKTQSRECYLCDRAFRPMARGYIGGGECI
jgi:hypothetical protein